MVIDKLALIDLKNKKILMALNKGLDTWYIPGGKREGEETDEQALIREVEEELAVSLDPKTIKFFGIWRAKAHNKPEGTMIKLTCYTASYSEMPKATSEVEKIEYFSYSQKHLTGYVDHLVFDYLKGEGLIK